MMRKKRCSIPHVSKNLSRSILVLLALLFCLPIMAQASIDVTLEWDNTSNPDITSYKVFCRQGDSSYDYTQPAWTGSTATCTISREKIDTGNLLEENVNYYFVARAVDKNGNESGNSNEVQFYRNANTGGTETDPSPPERPHASNPSSSSGKATLTPLLTTTGYHDVDANDLHAQSRWRIFRTADDVCVFDFTSSRYLTELKVPQLILDANTQYDWIVQFTNDKGASSLWSDPARFTTQSNSEDKNQNGIPDTQEVNRVTDLDNDGEDDSTQEHIKCVNMIDAGGQMGISILGQNNISALDAVTSISTASADADPTHAAGKKQIDALISFRLLVALQGDTASVRLHLSDPLPAGIHWYHFDTNEVLQNCGDYAQISQDRMSVTLEITDGGFGDNDGVANGVIVTRAAYGQALQTAPAPSNSGSSSSEDQYGLKNMSCFIQSLLSDF